ncbi:MAG: hypothetical protein ABI634_09750 [Acidobacteriota bacterium]
MWTSPRFAGAVLIVAAAATPLAQAPTPATTDPPISLAGAAFDVNRERLVIAGAAAGRFETWERHGTTWTRASTGGPSARDEALMVYDTKRRRTVLYGGHREGVGATDTWAWDGATWQRLATDGPPARTGAAMTYDATRDRIVLFGGGDGMRTFDDTWEWDGALWRRVALESGARIPPARALTALAYDARRKRTVLAGGFRFKDGRPTPFDDTWEWNGVSWADITTPGPGPRDHVAMVYDPDRAAIVLHGGSRPDVGLIGDTWTFDGRAWKKLRDDGPPRGRHRMVFDTTRHEVLLFGGWGRDRFVSTETWALGTAGWRRATGPAPRMRHAMATAGDGGVFMLGGGPVADALWHFDVGSWRRLVVFGGAGHREAAAAGALAGRSARRASAAASHATDPCREPVARDVRPRDRDAPH